MTPNIQLKSEKLKQSSRCFVCLMPNILMFSTIQMFGIGQTHIPNLEASRCLYLVETALAHGAAKTGKLDITFPDCRDCESHKIFMRGRWFRLKSERSLELNTEVNRALPEELIQRKEKDKKAHCSSDDFAVSLPASDLFSVQPSNPWGGAVGSSARKQVKVWA